MASRQLADRVPCSSIPPRTFCALVTSKARLRRYRRCLYHAVSADQPLLGGVPLRSPTKRRPAILCERCESAVKNSAFTLSGSGSEFLFGSELVFRRRPGNRNGLVCLAFDVVTVGMSSGSSVARTNGKLIPDSDEQELAHTGSRRFSLATVIVGLSGRKIGKSKIKI